MSFILRSSNDYEFLYEVLYEFLYEFYELDTPILKLISILSSS